MVPPVQEYAAILASPIFAPDRRPGPSGPDAEGGGGSLGGYAALGAAVGREVASAVISSPGGGVKTVRRGEEVDGWNLVGVDRTHVYFERKGVRHALVIGAPPEAAASKPGTDADQATNP
jgi:hypothetical protein